MAQQTINLGAAPNDDTGDSLRDGGDKINDNFTELYTAKDDHETRITDLESEVVAFGVHTWSGSGTTNSISVAGLASGDVVITTLVARGASEELILSVNDHANDQIDLTLSANGTDAVTQVSYLVLRP